MSDSGYYNFYRISNYSGIESTLIRYYYYNIFMYDNKLKEEIINTKDLIERYVKNQLY